MPMVRARRPGVEEGEGLGPFYSLRLFKCGAGRFLLCFRGNAIPWSLTTRSVSFLRTFFFFLLFRNTGFLRPCKLAMLEMDEFHPVLARMRIAALQSEYVCSTSTSTLTFGVAQRRLILLFRNRALSKNPQNGFVRSQRSKVSVVRDPSGGWKLGKKRIVRARSGSASSASSA